ncbi:MAG: DUF4124 domain-containing protein [Candidatus Thiodiazotropha sp.]
MKNQILIIFFISITFSTYSVSEIYKWRDESGRVHFGDKPAAGVEKTKIELAVRKSQWVGFKIKIDDQGVNLTDDERARIETDVNAVYRFFDKKLYFDIYKTIPINVKIFGHQKEYKNYIAEVSLNLIHTRGIYIHSKRQIALYMREDRESTFQTIKHEVSHAIIRSLSPYISSWLNEGLAENMEMITVENNRLFLGVHEENFHNLIRYDKNNSLMQASKFIALKSKEWRKQNISSKYVLQTQAGELVRLLLSTPQGRSFVIRLLHAYKSGDRTLASRFAEKHYVGGLFALEQNWEKWKRSTSKERISL